MCIDPEGLAPAGEVLIATVEQTLVPLLGEYGLQLGSNPNAPDSHLSWRGLSLPENNCEVLDVPMGVRLDLERGSLPKFAVRVATGAVILGGNIVRTEQHRQASSLRVNPYPQTGTTYLYGRTFESTVHERIVSGTDLILGDQFETLQKDERPIPDEDLSYWSDVVCRELRNGLDQLRELGMLPAHTKN